MSLSVEGLVLLDRVLAQNELDGMWLHPTVASILWPSSFSSIWLMIVSLFKTHHLACTALLLPMAIILSDWGAHFQYFTD